MIAHAPGFDMLAYARRLKEAGFDEAQAEAHAEAVRDAVTEGVATKADIKDVTAAVVRLEDKIDAKADKADLANLETRLVRLVYTVAAGQAVLVVGAVFALLKPAGTP